ncbi:MAG: hypothetical protein AAGC93_12715 [Cyanobacteria bacterium P01_F01_bin.53]
MASRNFLKIFSLCLPSMLIFFAWSSSSVFAQTEEELQEEIRLLELEEKRAQTRAAIAAQRQAEAEARQAEITAENAARDATLPNVDRGNLSAGEIDFDDAARTIEVETLAYEAVEVVARNLYQEITEAQIPNLRSIIVYDDDLAKRISTYRAYRTQLQILKLAYDQVLDSISENGSVSASGTESSFQTLFAVPTAIAEGAANFLSLFRTEIEVKGVALTDFSEAAVVASLANEFRINSGVSQSDSDSMEVVEVEVSSMVSSQSDDGTDVVLGENDEIPGITNPEPDPESNNAPWLQCPVVNNSSGIDIYYPDVFPLEVLSRSDGRIAASSCEAKIFNDLSQLFNANARAGRKLQELEAIKKANRSQAQTRQIEQLKALNTNFNTFVSGLLSPSAGSGTSALSELAQIAKLEALSRSGGYLMRLDVSAGGNTLTTSHWFSGTSVRHSGGVITTYIIINGDGAIQASGTEYHHTGYQRLNRPTPQEE